MTNMEVNLGIPTLESVLLNFDICGVLLLLKSQQSNFVLLLGRDTFNIFSFYFVFCPFNKIIYSCQSVSGQTVLTRINMLS